MKANGYSRIFDCGNMVFVKEYGDEGAQVLEKLDVTRKTLNSYVKSGKIRVKELGNGFYDYDEEDVTRLAKDVSCRNKVVVYIGKDFHEFGCTEKQARELMRVVMDYLGKPSK